MNNICSYRGFTFQNAPGAVIWCPVCGDRLIAIERNGRAWIPAHEIKQVINVKPYQIHTKGTK